MMQEPTHPELQRLYNAVKQTYPDISWPFEILPVRDGTKRIIFNNPVHDDEQDRFPTIDEYLAHGEFVATEHTLDWHEVDGLKFCIIDRGIEYLYVLVVDPKLTT